MREFADAVRRLHGLLEAPEPGLVAWHMAVESVMGQVTRAYERLTEKRGS